MGCTGSSLQETSPTVALKQPTKLRTNFTCPNCLQNFKKGQLLIKFNEHVTMCITHGDEQSFGQLQKNELASSPIEEFRKNDFIFEKIPDDEKGIHFSWSRVLKKKEIDQIRKIREKPEQVKKWQFQEKLTWFRAKLQILRIGWEHGCDWIHVDKNNIIESSIDQVQKVDMHRQIKIDFLEEKGSDAGGIFREWTSLLAKQIFDVKPSLFNINDSDQFSYKLRSDPEIDDFTAETIFGLLGTIIGKAIFDKVPLTTYLDRTILRQLIGQPVTLPDIYNYDKGLYFAWCSILDNEVNEDYQLYFSVIYHTTVGIEEVDLIPDGRNIAVTQNNKKQYIEKCIKEYCTKRISKYLNYIKENLYKVIPQQLLSVFKPHQLQMIMYGVPFIDLTDWKANTEYKGAFHEKHKTIKWFWEYLEEISQEKLSKILHFCTGSSRTPIHGFRKLEINRGNYGKFTIQSSTYDVNKNPYPKGHTCFNRLELPVYPTRNQVRNAMQMISTMDIAGYYGLD